MSDVDVYVRGTIGERRLHDRGDDRCGVLLVDGTTGSERSELDLNAHRGDRGDRFGDVRAGVALDERFNRELHALHED